MLEKITFGSEPIAKRYYKERHSDLIDQLVMLQQDARISEAGLVVLFEGWDGSGKGTCISDLLYNLDARSTSVVVTPDVSYAEVKQFQNHDAGVSGFFPFMQEFWKTQTPAS